MTNSLIQKKEIPENMQKTPTYVQGKVHKPNKINNKNCIFDS